MDERDVFNFDFAVMRMHQYSSSCTTVYVIHLNAKQMKRNEIKTENNVWQKR